MLKIYGEQQISIASPFLNLNVPFVVNYECPVCQNALPRIKDFQI